MRAFGKNWKISIVILLIVITWLVMLTGPIDYEKINRQRAEENFFHRGDTVDVSKSKRD